MELFHKFCYDKHICYSKAVQKMRGKDEKDMKAKNVFVAMLLTAGLVLGLTGCQKETASTEATEENVAESVEESSEEESQAEESEEETQEEEEVVSGPKQVIVYFANWNLDGKAAEEGGEVASIPWDSVTIVNHAFWATAPADGSTETSFERRDKGEAPRTEFEIVSTNAKMDYEDTEPSAVDPSMQRNHFAEYAAYSEKYPDVDILISIGGWTACGYFSEMAYTPEGRTSFVNSCMALMEQYPWIDGIDVDWEHPGGSNDGERLPESDTDQGCPIWGTPQEDTVNFAALMKELREAMDAKYGAGEKLLTACASASTAWTLPNQDWAAAEPYLDFINIMTYDLAGDWDGVTGHASSVNGAKGAMGYFMKKGIDPSKLNIGSPMYGTGFMIGGQINPGKVVGTPIIKPSGIDKDTLTQTALYAFEADAVSGYDISYDADGRPEIGEEWSKGETETGWHFAYDSKAAGAYMYNDDENSEYYKWYISYENPLSLQAKLDTIEKYNLAGIIVWECSEDTVDHKLIRQMGDFLLKNN